MSSRELSRSPGPEFRSKGIRQGALAFTPGNFFDGHYATATAIDAPPRVQQEDEIPIEG